MTKFRKKPIVIDAEQFWPDKVPWPEGVRRDKFTEGGFYIGTLEGHHQVTAGDWIITGVKGERYPCKPDIFDLTYEEVQNDS